MIHNITLIGNILFYQSILLKLHPNGVLIIVVNGMETCVIGFLCEDKETHRFNEESNDFVSLVEKSEDATRPERDDVNESVIEWTIRMWHDSNSPFILINKGMIYWFVDWQSGG